MECEPSSILLYHAAFASSLWEVSQPNQKFQSCNYSQMEIRMVYQLKVYLLANTDQLSNIMPMLFSPTFSGTNFSVIAFSKLALVGPWAHIVLLRANNPASSGGIGSVSKLPLMRKENSVIVFRWNRGGLKLCSITSHRGPNTTTSAAAWPGDSDGHVRTVKIEGSYKTVSYSLQILR